jgi:peptide/nickel transport system permease protein
VGRYVARRLLAALPTLLALSFLIFALVSAAPGDPAEELARRRAASEEATPRDVAEARKELHLDRPFVVQYAYWLGGAVTGDLGESFLKKQPVSSLIWERLPATLELTGASLLAIVVLSVPLGMAAAVFHGRLTDQALRVGSLVGASVPTFFFAYLLIIYFVTRLRLFPVAGRDGLSSLVLPAAAITLLPVAIVARLLRSSLLEVLGEDYIRTARSKGLKERVVLVRHALRNAAIPVVTYLGTVLGEHLAGVIVVEFIFAWPGVGLLTVEAIYQRDYPMIQGLVVLAGAAYLLVNLAVDVSYRYLDPRIRLESGIERL